MKEKCASWKGHCTDGSSLPGHGIQWWNILNMFHATCSICCMEYLLHRKCCKCVHTFATFDILSIFWNWLKSWKFWNSVFFQSLSVLFHALDANFCFWTSLVIRSCTACPFWTKCCIQHVQTSRACFCFLNDVQNVSYNTLNIVQNVANVAWNISRCFVKHFEHLQHIEQCCTVFEYKYEPGLNEKVLLESPKPGFHSHLEKHFLEIICSVSVDKSSQTIHCFCSRVALRLARQLKGNNVYKNDGAGSK